MGNLSQTVTVCRIRLSLPHTLAILKDKKSKLKVQGHKVTVRLSNTLQLVNELLFNQTWPHFLPQLKSDDRIQKRKKMHLVSWLHCFAVIDSLLCPPIPYAYLYVAYVRRGSAIQSG